jgi:hypothetical protein
MSRNFYQAAKPVKLSGVIRDTTKSPTARQHNIIAIYVEKNGHGSFYAKVNNKKYLIENYKLTNGKVYSKPGNDQHEPWTMKVFDNIVTFDKYVILEKMWASLYHGQVITGKVQQGVFILTSKTDNLL